MTHSPRIHHGCVNEVLSERHTHILREKGNSLLFKIQQERERGDVVVVVASSNQGSVCEVSTGERE